MSAAELHKSYPAVREAVAGIRHDVAAVVSFLGANEEAVERVRLAVSEAATSIVQNVFEHSSGRIHVALWRTGEGQIAVTVADDASGAAQRRIGAGLGLGFVVMRECADTLEVRHRVTGGIEVEMHFSPRPASTAIASTAAMPAPASAPACG